MNDIWYETVDHNVSLTQGDIVFNCPIITWTDQLKISANTESEIEILENSLEAIEVDVIIMTQACDIQNNKVNNLILCPHYSLSGYKIDWENALKNIQQNPSKKAWRRHCDDICDGYCWNLNMLNAYYSSDQNLLMEQRIVDFHDVYTLPISFLSTLVEQRQQSRFRLLSPYREHLSQAFARYFMRVGLPNSVDRVWKN